MKKDEQKNWARNFHIRKYAFLIFEKGISKKTAPGILRFVSMFYLIFEKSMSQKIVPLILPFLSMLFLISEKGTNKKILLQEF